MATHSSILAWKVPWAEEAGGLLSVGSQRAGYDVILSTKKEITVDKLHRAGRLKEDQPSLNGE